MHGEQNSLQALFLNGCPYAYCKHYFCSQADIGVICNIKRSHTHIHEFFTQLTSIINFVNASHKMHDQPQVA